MREICLKPPSRTSPPCPLGLARVFFFPSPAWLPPLVSGTNAELNSSHSPRKPPPAAPGQPLLSPEQRPDPGNAQHHPTALTGASKTPPAGGGAGCEAGVLATAGALSQTPASSSNSEGGKGSPHEETGLPSDARGLVNVWGPLQACLPLQKTIWIQHTRRRLAQGRPVFDLLGSTSLVAGTSKGHILHQLLIEVHRGCLLHYRWPAQHRHPIGAICYDLVRLRSSGVFVTKYVGIDNFGGAHRKYPPLYECIF